jgi:transposase
VLGSFVRSSEGVSDGEGAGGDVAGGDGLPGRAVAEDDRYRRLDRLVDWSFVREVAAPYYADEVGRPSIDPIVLVKLMVAGALEGIGSTRELLRQASVRLDLRRFPRLRPL